MTNGDDSVTSGDRMARRLALAIFVIVGVAFAVVNALSEVDERSGSGDTIATWKPWTWELTSFVSFLLLAPLIIRLSQRLQPPFIAWPRAIAIHVLLTVPASFAHVAIMFGLRSAIYAAMDDTYAGAGVLGDVLLYEYRKDLITYAALAALPHLSRRLIDARHAQQRSRSADYRIEVRDGGRRRWLSPVDIEWAQAAGNYVELFGPFGTLLHRRTLAALAEELRPYGFVRIHRSRIVRKAAVTTISTRPSGDFEVTVQSDATIAGSRRYRDGLR